MVEVVRIRIAGCLLLCGMLLVGGTLLWIAPTLETALVPSGESAAVGTAGESAGNPRSGRLPGEHASAMLTAPHLTGPGGPAVRPAGRFVPAFRVQHVVSPSIERLVPLSGRPLTIPLLI